MQKERKAVSHVLFYSVILIFLFMGIFACETDEQKKADPQTDSSALPEIEDTDTSLGFYEPLPQNQNGQPVSGPEGTDSEVIEITLYTELPAGFTPANPHEPDVGNGGWKVVGALSDLEHANQEEHECANILRVIVRDFSWLHEDFGYEAAGRRSTVLSILGDDRKPLPAPDNEQIAFEQWYRNVDGVNIPFAVDLWLEPVDGTFVFDSSCFFPIDGYGFDEEDWADCDSEHHNFLFTTELHTAFEYKGGEVFTFIGDDDVFVFINNILVVDLGGIHPALEGFVDLDEMAEELGLEIGQVYNFDLFQAERQPTGSNFRIETTLDFSGCGIILPSDIIIK